MGTGRGDSMRGGALREIVPPQRLRVNRKVPLCDVGGAAIIQGGKKEMRASRETEERGVARHPVS